MKIGLLEDNPAIFELLQTALKLAGHSVFTHIQGQSLLDALFDGCDAEHATCTSLPYDLLIIDLNLPGELSGLEVITSVYQQLTPDRLPAIVMTAGSLSELDMVRSKFPMLPIIRKPFALQALVQTISSLQPVAQPCVCNGSK